MLPVIGLWEEYQWLVWLAGAAIHGEMEVMSELHQLYKECRGFYTQVGTELR